MCSKATRLAFVLIATSLFYHWYEPQAKAWLEGKPITEKKETGKRIAFGLNADVDLILPAIPLLKALNVTPGKRSSDHNTVTSANDLQEVVAYSMTTCSGVERAVTDKELFDHIMQLSVDIPHEEYIGGNAALMAEKMVELAPNDSQILLAAPIGQRLSQYLNPSIIQVTPENLHEEVHVILEYSKGAKWGTFQATCANRVIISHDIANSELSPLEAFQDALPSFHPDLVVVSGIHMLENQPREFWLKRLRDFVSLLESVPRETPVHLELASVANLQFLSHVAVEVFPFIDSLGLNEQELVSVAKSAGAKFDFNAIGSKPAIPDTSDLLHWLYKEYGALSRKDSRLTRIHFHTLSFHILIQPKEERAGIKWKNGLAAASAGSKAASLQACDRDSITLSDFELQIPMSFPLSHNDEALHKSVVEYNPDNGYVAWLRESTDYFMVPVYVCRKPAKTVGLGDTISATGLLKSEFTRVWIKKGPERHN